MRFFSLALILFPCCVAADDVRVGDSMRVATDAAIVGDTETGGDDHISAGDDHRSGDVGAGDEVLPFGDLDNVCPLVITVQNVQVADLYALTQTAELFAVVDVRESDETETGVIDGALLYPWRSGVLQASHDELPADRPLYVVCQSGGRSAQASAFLVANGHTCIHNVLGGMTEWVRVGYPVVTP